MCGFLTSLAPAWQDRSGPVAGALHERGPDAHGVAHEAGATFVHTRLSILGLGREGNQPARSADGRKVLVFNGEIYNYRELARAHRLGDRIASDTQVLLELLTRLEPADVVAQLRGMYAFAYFDADRASLVAARDPMGIKPLYLHTERDGQPTLASCLPALLAGTTPAIDSLGLLGFLAFGHTGPVRTVYQDVTKLLPGQLYRWQRCDDGRVTASVQPVDFPEQPRMPVRQALADSVRAHLVSDVEVGAFLSGGVDSTLLAALAIRETGALRTFTVSFPEAAADESALAASNARLLGSRHEEVPATGRGMVAAAATFLRQHGEPFGDAACLPLTVLSERAGESLKVVLCGEGADELFGGYSRYRVARRLARTEGPAGPAARWWANRRGGQPWARALEAALWGGGFRAHAALLDGELALMERVAPQLARRFATDVGDDWRRLAGASANLDAARRYDLQRWLPNVYLEKTDRATMSASLEGRLPYLDRVVAAAAPLPRPQGTLKLPLRELLYELLPGVQLPERKLGLSVDIWALRAAGLDQPFRAAVQRPAGVLGRAFGVAAVRALAERAEHSPSLFFRLAMLGLWEQQFAIDASAVSEPAL